MKKDIHPNYREVVFKDVSSDFEVLTRSTVKTTDMTTYQGKEYPLFKVDISSASHPFYTGKQRAISVAGRVERFNKKYNIAT